MNIFKLKLPNLGIQFSFPRFQALRSAIPTDINQNQALRFQKLLRGFFFLPAL